MYRKYGCVLCQRRLLSTRSSQPDSDSKCGVTQLHDRKRAPASHTTALFSRLSALSLRSLCPKTIGAPLSSSLHLTAPAKESVVHSSHNPIQNAELGMALPPQRSTRDVAIEQLSHTVFGRGNVHLKNVETLTSLPEGLHSFPEVCFIGKPNVGKSTIVACLLHNASLARAGRSAGTTRLLQFFNVGDALLLVDTPGYGWWQGRRLETKQAQQTNAFSILFRYLALRTQTSNLKRVYWVMEANARGPVHIQPRDEEIRHFLTRERIPFSVLLSKTDRHWRVAKEQAERGVRIQRDGTPVPLCTYARSLCRQSKQNGAHGLCGSATAMCPEEGVMRNMSEIYAFLGTTKVPVLAVSANRQQPSRCQHLEALQHDIVYYCAQELATETELNLRGLQSLSYAPSRAEEVTRVQLRYPVESFVIPTSDDVTLAKMVERHTRAKESCVSAMTRRQTQASQLTQKDVRDCGLGDDGTEDSAACLETAETAAPLSVAASALSPLLATSPHVHNLLQHVGGDACSVTPVHLALDTMSTRHCAGNAEAKSSSDTHRSCRERLVAEVTQAGSDTLAHSSSATVSLPVALDAEAQGVTAINGVRIPRSMIMPSVEELARYKEDEMSAFASRSGAGAYEKLLREDDAKHCAAVPLHFVEFTSEAKLSEEERETLTRPATKSAVRQRRERMLSKYVARIRRDRSVYMQAEGYMCPWLADGSSRHHGVDATIMGLRSGGQIKHNGSVATGSRMRGLKSCGFGGRSHSARTLRNCGRATKKTGFWAT